LDSGITTFDTAEQYGNGRSEVILGAALKGHRHDVFVISKTGWMMGADGAQSLPQGRMQTFDPASIIHACEQGLRRLQTHYIDAYLLHDPPMHIVAQDGPFEALQRLQQAGKIRWWGVSANAKVAAEAVRRWDAQVVETPFNVTLTDATKELFPVVRDKGAGVIARSPFASGLLTLGPEGLAGLPAADWRHVLPEDRWQDAAKVREKVAELAGRRGEDLTETAIRFVLSHDEVSTCLVGISSIEELESNMPASVPPYLEPAEVQGLLPEIEAA
jgi:aryl-alcohol dehydrogenase-like predicted oxidoreductase